MMKKGKFYLKIIILILSGGFSSESGGIIEKGKKISKILQLTSSLKILNA